MQFAKENKDIYDELIEKLEKEKINYSVTKLDKALNYAAKIYKDTKRYKGESTMYHAIHVAQIVSGLKIGPEAVYASILHEVLKFEECTFEDLKRNFGEEVASLVRDSSKLYLLNYDGQKELEAENLRKMFMAIAKDIRVVIIKLADRLYNMRNIFEEPEEVQIQKAHETMNVYAPIAHRLGMSAIKSEMEDISFSILHPQDYEWVKEGVELGKEERQEYINTKIEEIKEILEKEGIKATIYGRPKFYYSIYRKTRANNCRVEDLFDLYAIRVIVNSVKDCYTVLGIIHEKYRPMPGRFKDYIAVPKTNMYQSLHTTLFGTTKKAPFEVQIRTWNMHKVAEYGVAAHFLYKEGKTKMSESDEKLNWLRKTIEFENEIGDGVYADFKTELFGDEVFVFTPKGEIKSFPKGSSTIDYAYSIHSKIGDNMVGAKINSKMVPIFTKLKNTDIVEIVTKENSAGPNLDWLKNVKTTSAKNKIVNFLKKQDKEVNIQRGEELLEKEIIKSGIPKDEILTDTYMEQVAEKMKFRSFNECLENVGFGILSVKKLANKLIEEYEKINKKEVAPVEIKIEEKKKGHSNTDGVEVEGIENCLVKFAKCCSPIPGDEIVGYITFGKGVSVHTADCPNLNGLNITQRRIGVKWREKTNNIYETKLVILANDREGITMDVLRLLQEMNIKLMGLNARQTEERECIIDVVLDVKSTDELQKVIKNLRKIDSVFDIRRAK